MDVGKLIDLCDFVARLSSCDFMGHEPVQVWTGNSTASPPCDVPTMCARCGQHLVAQGRKDHNPLESRPPASQLL